MRCPVQSTVSTCRSKWSLTDAFCVCLSCFAITSCSHFTLTQRWHNFLLYVFRHTSPAVSVYHPDEVWATLQQEQYRAVPTFASRGLPTMAPRIYIAQQMLGKLWKKKCLDRNMQSRTCVTTRLIISSKPIPGTKYHNGYKVNTGMKPQEIQNRCGPNDHGLQMDFCVYCHDARDTAS